jgi:hypothetical protein
VQNESVLNILKLIFAGSPLPEVLTIIARLVESQGEGLFCTIWLPDEEGGLPLLRCSAESSWIQRSREPFNSHGSPMCQLAVLRR